MLVIAWAFDEQRVSWYYPGQKKRTIPEIRGEKNAVPSRDILLDHARSAQAKVADDLALH